jgi:basic membrane protein A and related proteins
MLAPSPKASSCARTFQVGFIADVAGLRSSADAAGWRGVGQALRGSACRHAELALPARPSDYRRLLQAQVDRHVDLVIAGSFLLTDAVVDVARANPATHFVLVDPLIAPAGVKNLQVLVFRKDQAAFLAGALAGLVTQTGVVAGIYGPQGTGDTNNRLGFEHGARYVRPDVRPLGAYQPAQAGEPYANPDWGAGQARAFSSQQADVIFGAGGTTGQGALRAAAEAGRACVGTDTVVSQDPTIAACLLATSQAFIDRGVALTIADAIAGRWQGGVRSLGLPQAAVGLASINNGRLTPAIRQRLQTISDLLASGSLSTGLQP